MKKNSKMEYYVYELIDPRNEKVFYVGKGQQDRMYKHEKDVLAGRIPNNGTNVYLGRKIKKIVATDLKIKYKKVFITEAGWQAFSKEIELIKEIGLENLCNLTHGGEGGMHSPETKRKISENNVGNKGRIFTAEHRRKMSESLKGRISPMKGKKHSKESIRKMSKAMEGNTHCRGRYCSPEHKQNLSISCKTAWKKKAINEGKRVPWNKGKAGYKKTKKIIGDRRL